MPAAPGPSKNKALRERGNLQNKRGRKDRRSFHVDGRGRADIYTGLTVHAHILVNLCLPVHHGDRRGGALVNAGLAGGTFLGIDNGYHRVTPCG